jgi:hypothetical protein
MVSVEGGFLINVARPAVARFACNTAVETVRMLNQCSAKPALDGVRIEGGSVEDLFALIE